jgi:SAM-dependent methyltransferase
VFRKSSALRFPFLPGRVHPNELQSMSQGNAVHYARSGLSALANIKRSLDAVGRGFGDVEACLDMPSGYGRVLRWLCAYIAPAKITACEINRSMVKFCQAEFGVKGLSSQHVFHEIRFPEFYDLIWVGSLLTHLPDDLCLDLVRTLGGQLQPGGLLIFTTHGLDTLQRPGLAHYIPEQAGSEHEVQETVQRDGVAFVPYPNAAEYGVTFHDPQYVEQMVAQQFGKALRLVRYASRAWDTHQDVWAFQRVQP